jgi:hypothetical protein
MAFLYEIIALSDKPKYLYEVPKLLYAFEPLGSNSIDFSCSFEAFS